MTDVVLYHNPRCSKSREAKALLDDRGVDYRTRLYLNEPLNPGELKQLLAALGMSAHQLLRTKEAEYREQGLSPDSPDDVVIQVMADCPKLMERPVLSSPKGARIGRPPEAILDIL